MIASTAQPAWQARLHVLLKRIEKWEQESDDGFWRCRENLRQAEDLLLDTKACLVSVLQGSDV